ncbi:MAG TPA: 16S rRNA (adenine(1518)-N(6)/adenine(1519)-N(6))-dimethyltransferase RsmA [Bdellovibrionales bacterium]|nr:16S rRNA (adenine(1518)-N(6)/adenine(1519)-N(6))-dimethyltransferase RsmA [Bdellovibrionales bacterium]
MAYQLKDVQEKLRELGVSPKKSLGQNFLINPDAIDRIIGVVKRSQCDSIVEVGPGLGALTEPLLELGRPLTVVELDREFARIWRERAVHVIEDDALRIEWASIPGDNKILVSNLPYQISSSLVIDRSVEPAGVRTMVLMFQKEVAQRMMAKPNTDAYSLVSVIAQNAWRVERVLEISSKDFYPPPQVASQVLRFELLGQGLPQGFLNFVKLAFAHRRKLLIRNISGLADSAVLDHVWHSLKLDPKARPEDLSPKTFWDAYGLIQQGRSP